MNIVVCLRGQQMFDCFKGNCSWTKGVTLVDEVGTRVLEFWKYLETFCRLRSVRLRIACSAVWAPVHCSDRFRNFGCLWLPSWVYPVEVLHHLLGAKGEQHVLASSSSSKQQQASKKSLPRHRGSKPASK